MGRVPASQSCFCIAFQEPLSVLIRVHLWLAYIFTALIVDPSPIAKERDVN